MTKSVHDGFTLDDAKRTAREYAATAGFVTDRGAPRASAKCGLVWLVMVG
jgi:hypothetical protein